MLDGDLKEKGEELAATVATSKAAAGAAQAEFKAAQAAGPYTRPLDVSTFCGTYDKVSEAMTELNELRLVFD